MPGTRDWPLPKMSGSPSQAVAAPSTAAFPQLCRHRAHCVALHRPTRYEPFASAQSNIALAKSSFVWCNGDPSGEGANPV